MEVIDNISFNSLLERERPGAITLNDDNEKEPAHERGVGVVVLVVRPESP